MKKQLEYEIILNCILIDKEVRDCFLIWSKKTNNIGNFIKNNFPNLIQTNFQEFAKIKNLYSSDVFLVSKRKLDYSEYDTDEKLGKLLGYLSYDNFNKINKNETVYNYYIRVFINKYEINLFGELSQNKLNYEPIKNKVINALKDLVDDVKIIERNFLFY